MGGPTSSRVDVAHFKIAPWQMFKCMMLRIETEKILIVKCSNARC
uniref:Uncharacterized protein n=1 Tax=Aegilops tauschii subsp. strangulata TaxID=200361 RepID=A0A453DSK4_AEGTS